MARNTKANRILNDAAMRLEAARMRRHTAQSQLNAAIATHDALQDAYDALAKELAPTPRKKAATKAVASAPAQKEPAADPKCGVCYEIEDHPNHDMTYSSAHEFDRPKSARAAGKKSSRKSAATNSIANSEIPPAVAGSAVQEASAGD